MPWLPACWSTAPTGAARARSASPRSSAPVRSPWPSRRADRARHWPDGSGTGSPPRWERTWPPSPPCSRRPDMPCSAPAGPPGRSTGPPSSTTRSSPSSRPAACRRHGRCCSGSAGPRVGPTGPVAPGRRGRMDRVRSMNPRSVLSLDEIDLSDLAFWARPWAEREGAFALLRRERPLALFEEPDMASLSPLGPPPGPGYRAVTRHGDVTEISRHPEIYCSGQGAVSIFDLPPEMVEYFAGMISTDNPRHARLRRIVSAAFNPRRMLSIENSIEEVADRVIDRASGLGECDFVTEIAAALPLEIICDMMGVPPSEYATVFHSSNVILSSGDPEFIPEGSDPVLAGLEAGQQLTGLMHELSAHRVDHPTDDLTTALISTNIDGESLTQAELASFFILLLTAGNETTRNAITHGLWAFTEHPDQRLS